MQRAGEMFLDVSMTVFGEELSIQSKQDLPSPFSMGITLSMEDWNRIPKEWDEGELFLPELRHPFLTSLGIRAPGWEPSGLYNLHASVFLSICSCVCVYVYIYILTL